MEYVANPVVVQAYAINTVTHSLGNPTLLHLDNGEVTSATPEMLARIDVKVGDYLVIQSDGYRYLNPKDVFERKYSPKELS